LLTDKWRNSPDGKEKLRLYNQAHYLANKPKHNARVRLQRLVKAGIIKKLPCERCGNEKSQGHHPDYSKPLEVVWLCQSHHYDIDRRGKLIEAEV